ncbi:hypothetical protein ABZP36_017146 [Zizania latifolia]
MEQESMVFSCHSGASTSTATVDLEQEDFAAMEDDSSLDLELGGDGGDVQAAEVPMPPRQSSRYKGVPTPPWARELLFEKAVTPSDVGKLNRLVVPKQQAEKHFPFPLRRSTDAATGKGVLLNFEDGDGKVWRFRYSYWNSSQSYVLTKGWSRFVREKGLRPGDTVAFSRSACGTTMDMHLLIDCKKMHRSRPVPEAIAAADARVVKLFGVDIAGEKGAPQSAVPIIW